MSGLGHLLEAQGIATVVIGLVPQHVERVRPPRALCVPFPLGRPLGAPNQPELQQSILRAAFALLDRTDSAPIIEVLDVPDPEAGTAEEDSWACPVSFPDAAQGEQESLRERVQREVGLLQPWFEQGLAARKHTATGISGMTIGECVAWLGCLPDSDADAPDAQTFKLAAEDLKAFYLEAATAQPGAKLAELNQWLWRETALADLLWVLRKLYNRDGTDQALRLYAGFTLLPEGEVAWRKQVEKGS